MRGTTLASKAMVAETSGLPVARPSLERAQDDPAERQFSRRLRLYRGSRSAAASLFVAQPSSSCSPLLDPPVVARFITARAPGLFLNGPYFLAALTSA